MSNTKETPESGETFIGKIKDEAKAFVATLLVSLALSPLLTILAEWLWNPLCNKPKGFVFYLLVSLLPVGYVMSKIPILKSLFKKWHIKLFKYGSIASFLILAVYIGWQYSTKANLKGSILVAQFKDTDDYNIQQIIVRALKGSIQDSSNIHIGELFSKISENESESTIETCLNDCDGLALIWGSYSTNQNGNLILNIDFKDKCYGAWSANQYKSTKIGVSDPQFETSIENHIQSAVNFLQAFGYFIAEASTCSFKEAPAEAVRNAESYIATVENDSAEQKNLNLAYTFVANHYFNTKQYSESEKYLQRATAKFDSDIDLRSFRALNFRSLKRYPEAVVEIQKALSIAPTNPVLLSNLGILQRETGNYAESMKSYDLAIQNASAETNKKTISSFYSNRGSLHEVQNQPVEAISDYDKAIELDPEREKNYLLRGQALLSVGQVGMAESDLKKYSKAQPNDQKVLVQICRLYLSKRDLKEARKACGEALKRDKSDSLLRWINEYLDKGQWPPETRNQ